METIRAFIAIDIGEAIRAKLDELQQKLKKAHADVRWVKPDSMHLTLAFLGQLPLDKIHPLEAALDTSVQRIFDLEVAGTGFFGKSSRPRVLWAGITDSPPLMELQHRTVEVLQTAEVEFDSKPFSPHLTLGRIKTPGHTESLLSKLEHYKDAPFGRTRIEAVELIHSKPIPHGVEYAVLHRTALGVNN
ncbi:RNA 2',3'-cyclic phosphodiesterase [Pontiella sulfatireligans]|uniref:RNA 2',3'-cyclic phosphodiesterase n=1 Tax=Pontiella sulfatireligans TaxID=2750658 RepID=A0A6C2UTV6_9BACT|nr:RNA 2',3'-cyclic phosphodiesterase [Pontiella sulfatireligans]VGO22731.1 RNA 2',3'-cyclic phosphodiesterase [Pontiella sulfatireligans]